MINIFYCFSNINIYGVLKSLCGQKNPLTFLHILQVTDLGQGFLFGFFVWLVG